MHHIVQFLQTNGGELLYKTYEHITISLIAVILGVLVAVPLGVVLTRMKKGAGTIIGIVNIIQT
ncbi:choline ABC transporter permease OpuBB, partial [Xanthomonas citri pv. citri]|nr:choline ABC transporter permease OpuBB [Xanthomonas citri pv. citri]